MKQYYTYIKLNDNVAAPVTKVYITASNTYEAIQIAKATYGRRMVSESTMVPV